jgi:hypothetical protein
MRCLARRLLSTMVMATRSERYRANEEERSAQVKTRRKAARKARAKPKNAPPLSRTPKRKAARRPKLDRSSNVVEEIRGNSPETRFRKSRARAERVRGSGRKAGA